MDHLRFSLIFSKKVPVRQPLSRPHFFCKFLYNPLNLDKLKYLRSREKFAILTIFSRKKKLADNRLSFAEIR